jgi:hypothetical protein
MKSVKVRKYASYYELKKKKKKKIHTFLTYAMHMNGKWREEFSNMALMF